MRFTGFSKTARAMVGASLIGLTATLLGAGSAAAQAVSDCEWRASARNIVEPWSENSATFSNGAVRLALLDTIEPGAAALNLLLLSPPYDELGGRMCKVISHDAGTGFYAMYWDDLEASYDPAVGLSFHLPVEIWVDTGNVIVRGLKVTLNQATGVVEAVLLDGTEATE